MTAVVAVLPMVISVITCPHGSQKSVPGSGEAAGPGQPSGPTLGGRRETVESVLRICVIALILALASAARSSDFAACFNRAHGNFRDAQRRWHRAIHQAVLAHEPKLRALSEVNTELQLALIARAEKRVRSLALRTPPEVQFDRGLSGLLNPKNWSSTDESELEVRDPEYAKLGKRVAILRSQSDGNPDWAALRALFQTELMASRSVTQAQAELQKAGDQFVREARSCRQRQ